MMKSLLLIAIAYATFSLTVSAETSTTLSASFSSPTQQARLLELYTSEGCSSCPPADKRISKLLADDKLWSSRIPVVFHVDYWDYIGWKDRYAKPEHSVRQTKHRGAGNINSVYTPGFVVDGKEWRGFFSSFRWPNPSSSEPGNLHLSYNGSDALVTFTPQAKQVQSFVVNVAWLGIGLATDVKRGENRGHVLKHDFVILRSMTSKLTSDDGYALQIPFSSTGLPAARKYALVAWVESEAQQPVQAVGNWITLN